MGLRLKSILNVRGWAAGLIFGTAAGAILAASPVEAAGPVAAAPDGIFRGVATGTMNEFLGIRYAQSPAGDNRWRPPKRPARSFRIQDATHFANHCPQNASPFGIASNTEDCLFLNVFTPPSPAADRDRDDHGLRPVMFWMHGGALVVGESDDYDPTRLVEQGVIVVTINYRLGALGYLAHPAFGAEAADPDNDGDMDHAASSGNYGLMDQQLAMRWVRRNIIAFGGDPDNVTIFGESAGGLSTFSNLVSPTAAGLFERAIVESGAYRLTLPSLATAEAQGEAFATAVGCSDQTAACLRAVPLATLLVKENAGGYVTNVDGNVLPQSIDTALASGEFNRVPLMNGSNHDEWRLFVALNNVIPILLAGGTPADVAAAINPTTYPSLIAATLGIPVAATGPIVALYPPGTTTLSTELALGAVGTDAIFACPAHFATSLAAQFVPAFAYEFNDENAPENFLPNVGFPYGAPHASEIQYLFNIHNTPGVPVVPLNGDQQQLAANMVSYWTEFAEAANPNDFGTPFWPRFDVAVDDMQSLVPPTPVTEFNFFTAHNCRFWDAAAGRTVPTSSAH
jgi:para-nitrobenzyl esterase